MLYDNTLISLAQAIVLGASAPFAGRALYLMISTPSHLLGFLPLWVEDELGANHPIYKLITCQDCLSGWAALFMWPFLTFNFYPPIWLYCALISVGASVLFSLKFKI